MNATTCQISSSLKKSCQTGIDEFQGVAPCGSPGPPVATRQ